MITKKDLLFNNLITMIFDYQKKNDTYNWWDEESNDNDIIQELINVVNNNSQDVKRYFKEEESILLDTENELDILEKEQLKEIRKILIVLHQYENLKWLKNWKVEIIKNELNKGGFLQCIKVKKRQIKDMPQRIKKE